MITFNVKDLDPIALKLRAEGEAKRIFAKESTRKGRTYEEVLAACMYGQASELYMISQGYYNNPEPYQDILEKDKETPAEVKTTEGEYYVEYVLKRCADIILNESWRKHPHIVHIWINNKKDLIYTYNGKYVWNGKEFIVH